MDAKTSVSELQECCSRAKTGPPVYEYVEREKGGFDCKVVVLDYEALGNGRSKHDAKHYAANNILCKLRNVPGFGAARDDKGDVKPIVDELTDRNRDMLQELRDFCVRHDMPLPTIEIVQQSGKSSAPEYVASCSVASIKRYGKSHMKKEARHRAAAEVLRVINDTETTMPEDDTKLANTVELETNIENLEAQRRRKFKTYRELTDSGGEVNPSVKLCDRHNYFKNYYPHLKEAAFQVLRSKEYTSSKSKLTDVLNALKLTSRTTQMNATSMEPMLLIELICDYDCVFIGLESKVYDEMLEYFQDMLV